jgi:hypothetical protein
MRPSSTTPNTWRGGLSRVPSRRSRTVGCKASSLASSTKRPIHSGMRSGRSSAYARGPHRRVTAFRISASVRVGRRGYLHRAAFPLRGDSVSRRCGCGGVGQDPRISGLRRGLRVGRGSQHGPGRDPFATRGRARGRREIWRRRDRGPTGGRRLLAGSGRLKSARSQNWLPHIPSYSSFSASSSNLRTVFQLRLVPDVCSVFSTSGSESLGRAMPLV